MISYGFEERNIDIMKSALKGISKRCNTNTVLEQMTEAKTRDKQ